MSLSCDLNVECFPGYENCWMKAESQEIFFKVEHRYIELELQVFWTSVMKNLNVASMMDPCLVIIIFKTRFRLRDLC